MGKLSDKIASLGYHFSEGKTLLSVKSGESFQEIKELRVQSLDGQTMVLKRDNSPVMFPGGVSYWKGVMDTSHSEDIVTTCGEVYRDYYDLDENGYAMLLYNYSGRTKAYLDSEKARIGLTDYKEGTPEAFFALANYMMEEGVGEVNAGRYADGRFVAQTANPLFEEDHVLRMHYSRMPTEQDIADTLVIRKIERDFKLGRHREIFCCSACGEFKHWLDIPGGIRKKLSMRLKHRCGCDE